MKEIIQQSEIPAIITRINSVFGVHLDASDFKSANYSSSSLRDIVVQKIEDDKSGEWTTDMAFHKLSSAIGNVTGKHTSSISAETDLNALFPAETRKTQVKELEKELGFPLNILKPNSFIYALFIFFFFAGLPLLSVGWFPAVITMGVSGLVIFTLVRTANQFKVKTVGHLADHLAWKNYLKEKRTADSFNKEKTMQEVEVILAQ